VKDIVKNINIILNSSPKKIFNKILDFTYMYVKKKEKKKISNGMGNLTRGLINIIGPTAQGGPTSCYSKFNEKKKF
jgi:hypothetical protein